MEEIPPSPITPPAEPEAAKPVPSAGGRPGFAWWGWVLLVVMMAVLIWFLVNP